MRLPHRIVVAVTMATCFVAMSLPARGGLQETFDAANEAFWSGDHEAATERYEELIELGVRDSDVYFNLGTAYGRLGRFGPAILNLERALRVDPGHADARHNLGEVRRALARQRTAGGEDAVLDPPRSFWMNLLARVTPSQVGIPFLLCWVALFIVLGIRRLISRELPRLVLLVMAPLLTVAALTTGVLFASKAYYDASVQEAIAVHGNLAPVREGPADRFRRAFVVREGDRVRVLDEERGWIHIRDAEGHEGWGESTDFGLLRL